MKPLFLFLFYSLLLVNNSFGQTLISATYKGAKSKQQINTLFNLPLIKNGVKYYKITYSSPDAKGIMDTLSGLLIVPDNLKLVYPRLVYQHGTSDCKKCVPSFYGSSGGDEGQLGFLFGGLGFVSLLPDFVGMGEGRGFQTYVHAQTIISASVDMLKACEEWATQNGLFTNEQLFLTGYSQGGYASMALHKYLEEQVVSGLTVTAGAHMSGPYSLSGVMRDLILSDVEYFYPAYVPNTIMGFNETYENIYTNPEDFFKPEYVSDIKKYYAGTISLTSLNSKLIQLLKSNTGASVGGRMIREDVKSEIISNPNHVINKILRENDVYNWAPKLPTRILYCKADDQVPFMNSVVARDTMLANGATNLIVTDVNSSANHGACVTPALTQTVLFFLGLQKITSGSNDVEPNHHVAVFPNPCTDLTVLSGLEGNEVIEVFDVNNKLIFVRENNNSAFYNLDLSYCSAGMYTIIIKSSKDTNSLRLIKIQ